MKGFKVCRSPGVEARFVLMNKLRNELSSFRDILDFPPSNGSSSVNEVFGIFIDKMLILELENINWQLDEWKLPESHYAFLIKCTLNDLYKTYPQIRETVPVTEVEGASILQVYDLFCIVIGSLGHFWANGDDWMDKSKNKACHKLDLDELEELALAKLEDINKLARERLFDMMDEDEQQRGGCSPPSNTAFRKALSRSYSDNNKSCSPSSPATPTSVLPEITHISTDGMKIKVSSPSLFPLRFQAIAKLNPIDVKRLSFDLFPHIAAQDPNYTIQYTDPVKEVHRVETIYDFVVDELINSKDSNDQCSDEMLIDVPKVQQKEITDSDGTLSFLAGIKKDYQDVITPPPTLKRLRQNVAEKDGPAPVPPSPAASLSTPNGEDSQMSPRQPVSPCVPAESKLIKIQLKLHSPPMSPEGRLTSTHVLLPIAPPSPPPLQTQTSLVYSKNSVSPPPPTPPLDLPYISSKYKSFSPPPPPPPPFPVQSNNNVTPSSPPTFPKPTISMCPPPPFGGQNVVPPSPPPPMGARGMVPPPPPPPMGANGAVPPPPPPLLGKGGAPPPPPPIGKGGLVAPPPPPGLTGNKNLRLKKAATKLKRSSQMGNLYRLLKGKLEGSCLTGKSQGKGKIGAPAGEKQGMADALAEMTKRSAYFMQIEEDVKNHAQAIKEMKVAINSFQTLDMDKLIEFHKYVETHLEKLADESQVLARFEDFPTKKLEALRMSSALYSKLESIVQTLQNWQVVSPVNQVLDKIESYFTKIKTELDALERTKDEEAKKFQAHKITFDFSVLIRIKELMVDISSSCMELAIKEKREVKAKDIVAKNTNSIKLSSEVKKNGSGKIMWKAFQFAYRVYSFAGGHDDRADMLTRELAQEIESDAQL